MMYMDGCGWLCGWMDGCVGGWMWMNEEMEKGREEKEKASGEKEMAEERGEI